MADVTPMRARSVVEALRKALERAERGELRSVAIAFETISDSTGHSIGYGDRCWPTALLGEVEALKLTILVEDGRLRPKGDG